MGWVNLSDLPRNNRIQTKTATNNDNNKALHLFRVQQRQQKPATTSRKTTTTRIYSIMDAAPPQLRRYGASDDVSIGTIDDTSVGIGAGGAVSLDIPKELVMPLFGVPSSEKKLLADTVAPSDAELQFMKL